MGFSLNKVQLIGNLGQDAETRFTTSNVGVTSFSLATVHSYKDKSGEWQNQTTWHNITAWNLSDYMKGQLLKGKKFYVEGRLTTEEYKDRDGNQRRVTKIVAESLIPLDASNGNGNSHNNESRDQYDDNDDLPI